MSDEADDQAWLEALAGRAAGDAPADRAGAAARREAQALRAALLARTRVDEPSLQHEIDPDATVRATRLLDRARRDEFLAAALARRPAPSAARRVGTWGALLAAGLAGLAVALMWTLRPTPDAPVERGAPDAIHRMVADDPHALRSEIIAALRDAGVESTAYERFGRAGVDADLPRPLTPAVRAILDHYGIAAPADGVLRIEITGRGDP
ncbi:MAG: hypothetical protein AB7P31_03140 [Steroidobacteraceae bacterium]